MHSYKLSEIAEAIGGRVLGNGDLTISGAAEPQDALSDQLALAMDEKYAAGLADGKAVAAALWDGADWQKYGLQGAIYVPRPRVGMAGITQLMDPGPNIAPGIHPSAVIEPSAQIGAGAAVGPFVYVGPNVRIGENVRIGNHASVAEGANIGARATLYPGARVGRNVSAGDNLILHSGSVIGSDGFSFVTPEKSRAEAAREKLGDVGDTKAQAWLRIHSLGSVILGDDVEVGCNACIDAGTIKPTKVGNGTKIDNQVHVAHNCEIGDDCLFAGQVGIAGSVKIGNNVILGGQVGVVDNIFIGDGVVAGGGTVILSNVPDGRVLLGYPAMKMETHIETYKALRRLPRLATKVAELQKSVSKPDSND